MIAFPSARSARMLGNGRAEKGVAIAQRSAILIDRVGLGRAMNSRSNGGIAML